MGPFVFPTFPNPSLLTINGSAAAPVQLICAVAACSSSPFISIGAGNNGLTLSGFLFTTTSSGQGTGLEVSFSTVFLTSISLSAFQNAINLQYGAFAHITSITITSVTNYGILAADTAAFNMYVGSTSNSISGTGGSASGIFVGNARVYFHVLTVSNLVYGVACYSSGAWIYYGNLINGGSISTNLWNCNNKD